MVIAKTGAPILVEVERSAGEDGIAEMPMCLAAGEVDVELAVVESLTEISLQGRPLLGRDDRGQGDVGGFA